MGLAKMEIGEACQGAGEAAEDDRKLTFELEAAEALAGLARSFSLPGEFERRRCQQVDTDGGAISLSGCIKRFCMFSSGQWVMFLD